MLYPTLPRPVAFAGCCLVAAINARSGNFALSIKELGVQNAAFMLFEISAVIWFAMYAAWTIARSCKTPDAYIRGDIVLLCGLVTAILMPLPMLSGFAGLAAGLWLLKTSEKGSDSWRVAIIIIAIAAQQIFGRLFLALFAETILQADILLVGMAGGLKATGNVLTRPDGSNLIVAASCSSVRNMSVALLAWVTVTQLFRLRLDKRLALYVLASLTMIFLLNSARLLSMAWFPEYFDFLHVGGGAALFGWTGFILLAGLAGAAVLHIAPRQRRA
jgi:exosortase/archaeosortase family protein